MDEQEVVGAAVQNFDIVVDGDADERVQIDIFGKGSEDALILVEMRVGGVWTATTRRTSSLTTDYDHPLVPMSWAGVVGTNRGFSATLILDLRRTSTADRGGSTNWVNHVGPALTIGAVTFTNTADNITGIRIAGNTATAFAAGVRCITRRRKLSA